MKRIGWGILAFSSAAMLGPGLGWAQQQQSQPQGPGPWQMPMWGGGPGWMLWHGGFFHPFLAIFAVIGFVALIVGLARWIGYSGYRHHHGWHGGCPRCGRRPAIDILEERFARGEIGKDEFEEKRRLLGR